MVVALAEFVVAIADSENGRLESAGTGARHAVLEKIEYLALSYSLPCFQIGILGVIHATGCVIR